MFKWGLALPNSFWTHDDEILIGPKQRSIECSCIRAFHDKFPSLHRVNIEISIFLRILRANENQAWIFSKIYGEISTTWFRSHVEVNDGSSKSTISKSWVTMRLRSLWDLHTQGTQCCMFSSLFQELIVELLRNKRRKKPLKTLK